MSDDPLASAVQFLPGVGPARAELLARLGVRTVEDLLWRLPRDVLDLNDVKSPLDLVEGELQTVRGVIAETDGRETRKGSLTAALVDCQDDFVRALWFNQPWMRQRLVPGSRVLMSGKPKRSQGRWEFNHPRVQQLGAEDPQGLGGVVPRYGLTEGLSLEELQRCIVSALAVGLPAIADPLPEVFRSSQQLVGLRDALRQVHQPKTLAEYEAGRRRLLFDDLFEFQVGVALRRRVWKTHANAPVLPTTAKIDARIRRLFPFRFTPGQDAAIRDVAADLQSGRAMHRLLQADVGAGKTVVAIYALLVAAAAGYQSVLMAPTELLAMQHWRTIDELLQGSRVRRALLTGGLSPARRRALHDQLRAGEIDLVVGTQAVIQEDVVFARLGVVVVDEQHKFGVAQRAKFSSAAGEAPHLLVMTATPIPRSLCLTRFGDLDLSLIRDLPPGRQRVVTSRIMGDPARRKAWRFALDKIRQGRQLYIVCPWVDSDAASSEQASAGAEQVYAKLLASELHGLKAGLVHGRMDRDARDAVMQQFRDGALQVLVSTTVVEVGVDVSNATLMIILEAERFGLSQLHQLRGRIARGVHQGYCFLFSQASAADAAARLAALESSSDGFAIAEQDFALRGPGDVLGVRQHGELPLRCADLVRDGELLEEARNAALDLVDAQSIDAPEFAALKRRVLERFGQLMDLQPTG